MNTGVSVEKESYEYQRVKEKMAELEEALETALPNFPIILRDIHNSLRSDPDIVTLLSEEEIAVIVRGLEAHAGIEIAPIKAKSATSRAKKAPISAADL